MVVGIQSIPSHNIPLRYLIASYLFLRLFGAFTTMPSPPNNAFADPERSILIQQIYTAIKGIPRTFDKITLRTTWACLLLSDIEKLCKLARFVHHQSDVLHAVLKQVEARNIVKKRK